MQRENERGRVVVDGWRTDDGQRCSLLLVREMGGARARYLHGRGKFGVRLAGATAEAVAQMIQSGGGRVNAERSAPELSAGVSHLLVADDAHLDG